MRKLLLILSVFISSLGFSQSKLDSLVFNYINEYRVLNGINPLMWDTLTYKVGVDQVNYMSETNTCNHDQTYKYGNYDDSLFREKFRRNGIGDTSLIAENLTLIIFVDSLTDNEISCKTFQNWVDSKPHHELLLDKEIIYGSVTHTIKNDVVEYTIDDEWGDLQEWYFGDVTYIAFECRD